MQRLGEGPSRLGGGGSWGHSVPRRLLQQQASFTPSKDLRVSGRRARTPPSGDPGKRSQERDRGRKRLVGTQTLPSNLSLLSPVLSPGKMGNSWSPTASNKSQQWRRRDTAWGRDGRLTVPRAKVTDLWVWPEPLGFWSPEEAVADPTAFVWSARGCARWGGPEVWRWGDRS